MIKKCYVCMHCGQTHYTNKKPKKCSKCNEYFDVEKELEFIQCGNKQHIKIGKIKWW